FGFQGEEAEQRLSTLHRKCASGNGCHDGASALQSGTVGSCAAYKETSMRFGETLVAMTLVLAIFGTPSARAAENSWMGTAYVGYAKIIENSDNAKYSVPGGGLAVHGGAYRMLHPDMGLGLELGYQHYGEKDYVIPAEQQGTAGFSSVHLTLQALVQGTHGTTRPLGTLGAGW